MQTHLREHFSPDFYKLYQDYVKYAINDFDNEVDRVWVLRRTVDEATEISLRSTTCTKKKGYAVHYMNQFFQLLNR